MSRMMCQIGRFAISILHLPSYSRIEEEIATHVVTVFFFGFICKSTFNMYYMKAVVPKNVAIDHGSSTYLNSFFPQ